ncbi:hypothetical protein DLAC_08967 [Tieghemostelium lacteum]|uniref:FNIP repeat-containing protein n=1 Tax=Tieghemostelium lacteum TaxID=361077 RepID=A0A151Z8R3_TIELA|nr:hypothetical protein DLAC_08967 [Tieghemostelium lacteum]|eukprot:KYQ90352.1 hypothetical protein DLAC_08967 [Tieghemostelium lacteum]
MNILSNVVLFKCIIEYCKSDRDKLSLLYLDHSTYSFRNKIRFNEFPMKYFQLKYNQTRLKPNIPTNYKTIRLLTIDQLTLYRTMRKWITSQTLVIAIPSMISHNLRNERIQKFKISSYVKKLVLGHGAHRFLEFDGVIPDTVEKINCKFTDPPKEYWLPKKLKSLKFTVSSREWNPNILYLNLQKELPSSLIELKCNIGETSLLMRYFPQQCNITRLTIDRLNQPLLPGLLPSSIEYLSFDQVDTVFTIGSFPDRMKVLVMGTNYNHPIDPGTFPDTLRILYLPIKFNHILEPGSLPNGLKKLYIGDKYKVELQLDVIPKSLEKLVLGDGYRHELKVGVLSEGLKSLQMYNKDVILNIGSIPKSVESLRSYYISPIYIPNVKIQKYIFSCIGPLKPLTLPHQLQKLKLSNSFNCVIGKGPIFPKSLTTLIFGINYDQPIRGSLPPTLTNLEFGYKFNQFIYPNDIPLSVISLTYGEYFNRPLNTDSIPPSVKYLHLKKKNPNYDPSLIPQNVLHLQIADQVIFNKLK